jgi:hypothetical protein
MKFAAEIGKGRLVYRVDDIRCNYSAHIDAKSGTQVRCRGPPGVTGSSYDYYKETEKCCVN